MLTGHSVSSASFHWRRSAGLWVTEKCTKLHRKPTVLASRGMQDIHYGAAEDSPGTGWLGVGREPQ